MSYFGWKPYVPVAERRKQAEKAAAKARKAGADHTPIEPYRGAIAKTFWGKAWCDNLEHYSDYANRLPRGRTYVRNGSVIDLKLAPGEVRALVMGSSLYEVEVTISAVPAKHWKSIGAACAGSIDSLVELLQGKLAKGVMTRICAPGTGLFPTPKEIRFNCSCPDSASMCKHVAAVLYGVGARLDQQPDLLFALRHVDAGDLVALASTAQPRAGDATAAGKVLDDSALADVFGIEMVEIVEMGDFAPPPPRKALKKPAAKAKAPTKPAATKVTKATKASKVTKAPAAKAAKTVPPPKTANPAAPAKTSAVAKKPAKKAVFSVEMFVAAPKAPATPPKKPTAKAKVASTPAVAKPPAKRKRS